jgi:hypothetical protein
MLSAGTRIELRSPLKVQEPSSPEKQFSLAFDIETKVEIELRTHSDSNTGVRVLQQRYNKLFEATAVLATGNDSGWHGTRPQ